MSKRFGWLQALQAGLKTKVRMTLLCGAALLGFGAGNAWAAEYEYIGLGTANAGTITFQAGGTATVATVEVFYGTSDVGGGTGDWVQITAGTSLKTAGTIYFGYGTDGAEGVGTAGTITLNGASGTVADVLAGAANSGTLVVHLGTAADTTNTFTVSNIGSTSGTLGELDVNQGIVDAGTVYAETTKISGTLNLGNKSYLGDITASSGKLSLAAGTTVSGASLNVAGDFAVSATGTLDISGTGTLGAHTLTVGTGAQVTLGTLNVTGAGTITGAGKLNAANTTLGANLTTGAGIVDLGAVTVGANAVITAGTQTTAKSVDMGTTAHSLGFANDFTVSGTINNAGTTSKINVSDGNELTVANVHGTTAGAWDVNADNFSGVVKLTGTGNTVNITANNAGHINFHTTGGGAKTGTLKLNETTLGSTNGAGLGVGADSDSMTVTVHGTGTIHNVYVSTNGIAGGVLNVGETGTMATLSVDQFSMRSSTSAVGTMNIGTGSKLEITGSGTNVLASYGVINNSGTFNVGNNVFLGKTGGTAAHIAILDNKAGATFEVKSATGLGTLTNASGATFNVNADTTVTKFAANKNSGIINIEAGKHLTSTDLATNEGTINLNGAGAKITATTLENKGMIKATAQGTIAGDLDSKASTSVIDLTTKGAHLAVTGTLTLGTGAKLNVSAENDLATNAAITVTGDAKLDSNTDKVDVSFSSVNLASGSTATYKLITTTTGTATGLGTNGNYEALGLGRGTANFTVTGSTLSAAVTGGAVYKLDWSGAASTTWGSGTAWTIAGTTTTEAFAEGDYVTFGTNGTVRSVALGTDVGVAGMEIGNGTSYTFTGAHTIKGVNKTIDGTLYTGDLVVNGTTTTVTFDNNAVEFTKTSITGATGTINTTAASKLGALTLDSGTLVNTKNAGEIASVDSSGASKITNNNGTAELMLGTVNVKTGTLTLDGSSTGGFTADSATIASGATLTQSKALNITNDLVNKGTLTSGAALTVGGDLNNSGTLTGTQATTITGNLMNSGTANLGAVTLGTQSIITNNATANLTIASFASFSAGNTINNYGDLTVASVSGTIDGVVNLHSGAMTVTSGAISFGTNAMNFSGGRLVASSSAITLGAGDIRITLSDAYMATGTAGDKAAIKAGTVNAVSESIVVSSGESNKKYEILVSNTVSGTISDIIVRNDSRKYVIGTESVSGGSSILYTMTLAGVTPTEIKTAGAAASSSNAGIDEALGSILNNNSAAMGIVAERLDAMAGNQIALGRAITELNATNSISSQVGMSRNAVSQFNSTLGQVFVNTAITTAALGGLPNYAANAETAAAGGRPVTYSEVGSTGAQPHCYKMNGWIKAYGGWGEQDDTFAAAGYNFGGAGVMTGLDYKIAPELKLGALFGYSFNQSTIKQSFGDMTDQLLRMGIYGQFSWEGLFLNSSPTFGIHMMESKRRLTQFNDMTALGKRTGFDFNWLNQVGYVFNFGGFLITPSYSLAMTYLHDPRYEESGAEAANLIVDAHNSWSLTQNLELKLGKTICLGGLTLLPEIWAGWEHEYLDTNDVSMAFAAVSGTKWNSPVAGINKDRAVFGAGISTLIARRYEIFGRYDQKIWDGGYNSNFTVGLGIKF